MELKHIAIMVAVIILVMFTLYYFDIVKFGSSKSKNAEISKLIDAINSA